MSSSSNNKETQNSDKKAETQPESRCPVHPATFGAFKQAVVDTGNAILCKTGLLPDSEKCKKRVETKDAAKTTPPDGTSGECRCGEQPPQQAKRRSNSLNPASKSPSDTLEFIKFFSDDGR